jgi:signal transduction histidine kinase
MRLRLLLPLALLVLAPLAALSGLGVRLAQEERAETTARFEAVVATRLDETAAAVERRLAQVGRELDTLSARFPEDAQRIRALQRRAPRLRHLLMLDAEGELIFPPPDGPTSAAERAFLERTRGLWEGNALGRGEPAEGTPGRHAPAAGWHVWYWGGGLNLLYKAPQADGRLVAVEVGRPRLLADLMRTLPTTAEDGPDERVTLLDSNGRVVYQWGRRVPDPDETPCLTRPLAAPLGAWNLAWYGPQPADADGPGLSLLTGLGAVGLALIGLAVWFYRESSRELREAAQRVTFVNQVSHELKTPLTNIRMYAELLEDELFDVEDKAERYLGVIVGESQRLSRLIGNILTFARQQRHGLRVRPTPGVVDEVVERVLAQYEPSLRSAQVAVAPTLQAKDDVLVDGDALGQILGNLLSNVEKYAGGAAAQLETRLDGELTRVTVRDGGAGIPAEQRRRVFEPFARLSAALDEGVSGTGIGLGIARDLARLHGGDLKLAPTESGACFELTLKTPPAPNRRTP